MQLRGRKSRAKMRGAGPHTHVSHAGIRRRSPCNLETHRQRIVCRANGTRVGPAILYRGCEKAQGYLAHPRRIPPPALTPNPPERDL